ncbi:MAG: DNA translocase FtsK 4TM domain-containing protein [Bacillota bacterium]
MAQEKNTKPKTTTKKGNGQTKKTATKEIKKEVKKEVKKTTKPTASATKRKPSGTEQSETEDRKSRRSTTKVQQTSRFGDSILDEACVILILVLSAVVEFSLLTTRMGIFGEFLRNTILGIFGFSGVCIPLFVAGYCVWYLLSKERNLQYTRLIGSCIFLFFLAVVMELFNPTSLADLTFSERISIYYQGGDMANGGVIGGVFGSFLSSFLGTLGSMCIVFACFLISLIMMTGKSFFSFLGTVAEEGKKQKVVHQERVREKAEHIKKQERVQGIRKEDALERIKKQEKFDKLLRESTLDGSWDTPAPAPTPKKAKEQKPKETKKKTYDVKSNVKSDQKRVDPSIYNVDMSDMSDMKDTKKEQSVHLISEDFSNNSEATKLVQKTKKKKASDYRQSKEWSHEQKVAAFNDQEKLRQEIKVRTQKKQEDSHTKEKTQTDLEHEKDAVIFDLGNHVAFTPEDKLKTSNQTTNPTSYDIEIDQKEDVHEEPFHVDKKDLEIYDGIDELKALDGIDEAEVFDEDDTDDSFYDFDDFDDFDDLDDLDDFDDFEIEDEEEIEEEFDEAEEEIEDYEEDDDEIEEEFDEDDDEYFDDLDDLEPVEEEIEDYEYEDEDAEEEEEDTYNEEYEEELDILEDVEEEEEEYEEEVEYEEEEYEEEEEVEEVEEEVEEEVVVVVEEEYEEEEEEEEEEQEEEEEEEAEEEKVEKNVASLKKENTKTPKETTPPKPYEFPPIEFLGKDKKENDATSEEEMIKNIDKLETTLKSFGVIARVINVNQGPTVTRYELEPNQGVKVSKIVNLADDIALNLAASGIRIEAPIPGKAAVGIEVPNKERQSVYFRTVLESDAFFEHESKLAFALGEDIAGNPVIADIAKMPHLLIAGATGSGKSVCINTLITSIIYKATPEEVQLLLIDPKVVELSVYNGIPHLLIPVVTDPKKASAALDWAVKEMLNRYNDFATFGVRDMAGFNAMKEREGDIKGKMPQIVIVVDELADLMMAAGKVVEEAICRLAQMARAAGMHLIIATQRPSVDVITGVIKANIPSRLAFAVSSGIDSRTILDMVGAEKLLGRGDMLFAPAGQGKPARIQGGFVTDSEVEEIVSFLRKNTHLNYDDKKTKAMAARITGGADGDSEKDRDELFTEVVEFILEKEKASVSMIQRKFKIGYNRSARIVDQLEGEGIVSSENGSKPRTVLVSPEEWDLMEHPMEEEID